MKKRTSPNCSRNAREGIPTVLENLRYEKVTEVVPVKVQLSLKNCVLRVAGKQKVSTWIREAIIEKLQREK
jgi:hypothetical protein